LSEDTSSNDVLRKLDKLCLTIEQVKDKQEEVACAGGQCEVKFL
jgi:hypothetical protein